MFSNQTMGAGQQLRSIPQFRPVQGVPSRPVPMGMPQAQAQPNMLQSLMSNPIMLGLLTGGAGAGGAAAAPMMAASMPQRPAVGTPPFNPVGTQSPQGFPSQQRLLEAMFGR